MITECLISKFEVTNAKIADLELKIQHHKNGCAQFEDEIRELNKTIEKQKQVIEELEKTLEESAAQLDQSKMFHCPHYLTDGSGHITCHKIDQAKLEKSIKYLNILNALTYPDFTYEGLPTSFYYLEVRDFLESLKQ
jgi:chromosome segregation ATPase